MTWSKFRFVLLLLFFSVSMSIALKGTKAYSGKKQTYNTSSSIFFFEYNMPAIHLTFSEYSTTSRIERGYPEIRYALAAGAIFISNINTSVTVFDDNWEKSCISSGENQIKNENSLSLSHYLFEIFRTFDLPFPMAYCCSRSIILMCVTPRRSCINVSQWVTLPLPGPPKTNITGTLGGSNFIFPAFCISIAFTFADPAARASLALFGFCVRFHSSPCSPVSCAALASVKRKKRQNKWKHNQCIYGIRCFFNPNMISWRSFASQKCFYRNRASVKKLTR